MKRRGPAGVLASACVLSACTVVPLASASIPLVAYPGSSKTPAQFAQDDVACRAVAAPVVSQPVPSSSSPPPSETSAPVQPTPESVYFSCMSSHGNVIAAAPATTAYVYAYPYTGFPYGSLYAGPFADEFFLDRQVGLYGGFYGGFRRGGFGGFHGDEWRYRRGFRR